MARRVVGREDLGAHPGDGAAGRHEPGDAVAEPDAKQPGAARVDGCADEGLEDAGASAPGDVEAGNGVAVPACGVAAALGPLDEREPAHAEAPLLEGVDEEEPAEGPLGLSAERGVGFLLEDPHVPSLRGEGRGGDEAGEARADDEDVVVGHALEISRAMSPVTVDVSAQQERDDGHDG